MDMLANAQRWLAGVRKSSLAAEQVMSYIVKSSGERIDMTCQGVVVGSNNERLETTTYGGMDVEERDYIIPVEAFEQCIGREFRPSRGDEVEEIVMGTVYRFRIMAAAGEPPYEWHDRERTAFRIHCHLVNVE